MKKIIIASDSFKGSLSSAEVGKAVSAGIHMIYPECETRIVETGDGGEGTCQAIASILPCEWITLDVNDPLGRIRKTGYAICRDDAGSVAVIEMAQASGLPLLVPDERDPMKTSTYGTGEMIRDAAGRGCRRFIIGLGGSATNDGGTGMLEALGFRFIDRNGDTVSRCCGEKLAEIASVDGTGVPEEILKSAFTAACDVDTPFYGKNGATRIFAPQKGGSGSTIERLETGMQSFAEIIRRKYGTDIKEISGSGAAGGTAGALYAFLGASLCKGADLVLDVVGFDRIIEGADLVITGEGRIDKQTFHGKLPYSVLTRASSKGVPVLAIGGMVDLNEDEISSSRFLSIIPIQPHPGTQEELYAAMKPDTASANITRTISCVLSQYLPGKVDG